MDHANNRSHADKAVENGPATLSPILFNDVYASRFEAAFSAPCDGVWAPFPRLPVELRLHTWLLHLQRHRILELDICGIAADELEDSGSPQYTDRNHLGRIVSGGPYALAIRGRGSWTKRMSLPVSLLFWVSREARGVALSFYHIHLPFPRRQNGEQILYLNPEYDVVSVRTRHPTSWDNPEFASLLVDFLHDARAYDYKDEGVAHLALNQYWDWLFDSDARGVELRLTPETVHQVGATSFREILHYKLRSVLCTVHFRHATRGLGEFLVARWRYHFAQTFPLRRRGPSIGAFRWLTADPRPGVSIDLRQVPFDIDPRFICRGWCELERAWGITEAQRTARKNRAGGFRFYICPTQYWPKDNRTGTVAAEDETEELWSRDELAQYLQFEVEEWDEERTWMAGHDGKLPKYGYQSPEDTEMLERMEKLPCTAIGMWLFPAEAFKDPFIPRRFCFDLREARPGLFLFEV